MIRPLLRRVAGAAALATAAGLLTAPAFQAQAAPAATAPRVATALRIAHLHKVGPDGSVDVIRGRLQARRHGVAHRRVVLLARTGDSAWAKAAVHRTTKRGLVRFKVDPEETSAYRLVFRGTPRLQPARSRAVRVPVRPDVAITADPTSITQGESATVAGLVTLQGTPLADAKVKLWAVKVGHPRSARIIDRTATDADGAVSFVVTPRATTRYRLVVARSDASAGAVSAKVKVVVVAPSTDT